MSEKAEKSTESSIIYSEWHESQRIHLLSDFNLAFTICYSPDMLDSNYNNFQ